MEILERALIYRLRTTNIYNDVKNCEVIYSRLNFLRRNFRANKLKIKLVIYTASIQLVIRDYFSFLS